MPVYEYRCKSCGKTHEIEHGFHDERPTECPACGGELVRVFHPIGVVFKGSGFYKTDYGGSSTRPATGEGASSTENKPSAEKTSDSGTTPSAKPAESKPKPESKPPAKPSDS